VTHVRIGLVLSAGGLRGAAHLGVLRQIQRHDIPIHVIVGASAGAIIAAYYAAVGLSVDDMINDAPVFRGSHIVMHGLSLRSHPIVRRRLRRFCGVIPERLQQLEDGTFDRLHHGIEQIGVVCHDLITDQPCYFSTAHHLGARLADVVRASAAVPGVLPAKELTLGARQFRLADGGLSDSLPVAFARSPGLGATHLIVSDCRLDARTAVPSNESLVYIRPQLDGIRTLRAPRHNLMEAVRCGEAAVTADMVQQLQCWVEQWMPASAARR
jgi:NTE family protein